METAFSISAFYAGNAKIEFEHVLHKKIMAFSVLYLLPFWSYMSGSFYNAITENTLTRDVATS